jgi:tRNA(His) guanylyltransferase
MKDEIGDRMKKYYEDRTHIFLPRRTYTIIRVDGKAFHAYTRGLKQPFDTGLIEDMDATACYLCKNAQGSKFAFVQSDEISILLTDFDKIDTDAWFDGNIQKIASVTASMAASKFNQLRWIRFVNEKYNKTTDKVEWLWFEQAAGLKLAEFDARVFTIPCDYEVENYLIWRQQDAVRNSISSVALSLYSHKELESKNSNQKQEMIFQKGINWNDYASTLKRGRFIQNLPFAIEADENNPNSKFVMRNRWTSTECPIFTQNREFLLQHIPKNN